MAKKKPPQVPGVGQNLKFIGILTFGLTLSIFFIVSGLASLYSPIRKQAYERQIPFILLGEPAEPSVSLQPQKRPEKLEDLEQVRARMFSTRPEDLAIADLNNDGIVNIVDYLLAKKTLGKK